MAGDKIVDKVDVVDRKPIEFYTSFRPYSEVYYSCSGEPELQEYEYSIKNNLKTLVKAGKTNVYEKIQAEADAVDVNKLMLRFQSGETDVFDRVHGVYFDSTELPKTYAEMYQRVIDGQKLFDGLTPEVKEAFNNNPIEFFDQYGSPEFVSKMEELFPSEFVEPEPDVIPKKEVLDE